MIWLRVHVGGQLWRIHLVPPKSKYLRDDDGTYLDGWCDQDTCQIYIDKTLPEPTREDTLLHEMIHALFFVTGIQQALSAVTEGDATVALEEAIVRLLTPTMHRLLRDLGFRFPRLA